jgi:predicted dehydrogenase
MMLNVGLIGCGLIGRKRAEALSGLANLSICYDVENRASIKLSKDFSCDIAENIDSILNKPEIEVIFIATQHDSLSQLSRKVIEKGKSVFIEKPGGIDYEALREVEELSKNSNLHIHVGYNHRHHPAIRKAIQIAHSGEIGKIMFLRARYGHGGRVGYNNEWRADKTLSGGGELIDQGTHLLDLSQAFLGNMTLEYGATPSYFWEMPVEDNAFMVVKNQSGAIGFLHASCTEWKNTFSLEVYGETGKLEVSGLGGSYGIEKLTHYKMLPEMGPPETFSWEYPMSDDSWKTEVREFIEDITNGTTISSNLDSALHVLDLVGEIYRGSGR